MKDGIDQNFIFHAIQRLGTISVAVQISIGVFVILAIVTAVKVFHINIWTTVAQLCSFLGRFIGRGVQRKEKSYNRSREIGKFTEKTNKVKLYRFLNDLIIDLGLKKKGATPYTFLFVVVTSSLFMSILGCRILFDSFVLGILTFPIMIVFVLCVCYTKANIEHDTRIEAVMMAENIIANAIADGVVVAVRENINMMHPSVRNIYADFVDDVEQRNTYIKTALEDLQNNLGSISCDFIRKCIVFELEEEHGISGMFKDIVEINNIKMRLRNIMKRKFEEVVFEFIVCSIMIGVFLFGVIALYPYIADFYFHKLIGQIVLSLDLLLFVAEFVFITYLRAREI